MFDDYNEEDLIVTEYKFIFEEPDNGWWLEVDSAKKLIDYHKKTEKFYGDVIADYLNNKDEHWHSKRTYAVVMYAQKHHLTIYDAVIQFRMMIAQQQLEQIHKYGAIYINSSGGYHANAVYKHFVIKDKFIFPDYKDTDIKINQFPGGTHWYAYIGNMQIKNGNIENGMIMKKHINMQRNSLWKEKIYAIRTRGKWY